MIRFLIVAFAAASLIPQATNCQTEPADPVATYSIVGWDSATGDLGIGVQSKFLGVGAVVPFARAGVGAIATQAFANTEFGPLGLQLLAAGLSAQQVVDSLVRIDTGISSRQFGVVDAHGGSASYTGKNCLPYAGNVTGPGYTAQGNILAGEEVVRAMSRTFEVTGGSLADRLLASLDAAEKAGGDKRGRQSAALLVVRDGGGYAGFNDRFIDIRVDDDSLPLVALRRIYAKWTETFLFDARMRSIERFKSKRNFAAADAELRSIVSSMNSLLREKPDDAETLNRIAWILATYDIDHARALELAKRAAGLAPNDNRILDTMAECHYRLGQYDQAIAIEAELVRKEPGNDQYWQQLQKFREAKLKSGK